MVLQCKGIYYKLTLYMLVFFTLYNYDNTGTTVEVICHLFCDIQPWLPVPLLLLLTFLQPLHTTLYLIYNMMMRLWFIGVPWGMAIFDRYKYHHMGVPSCCITKVYHIILDGGHIPKYVALAKPDRGQAGWPLKMRQFIIFDWLPIMAFKYTLKL